MSKSKRKDNFNQAMYEMFGIGKETTAEADAPEDEDAEFFGMDPVSEPEPAAAPAQKAPEYRPEPAPAYEAPRQSAQPPRSTRTTFLAEGTSIEGTLRCDNDVEIHGMFKGELIVNGKIVLHADTTSNVQAVDLQLVKSNLTGDAKISNCITIDEGSNLTGSITAGEVVCSGTVHGNMNVTGNLTLYSKAKVFGDIKVGSLVVERGGRVTGKMEMSAEDEF